LEPGDERRITFTVAATQLGYTNARGGFSADPGLVEVFAGTSSADRSLTGSFSVAGVPRPLKSSERSFSTTVTEVPATPSS